MGSEALQLHVYFIPFMAYGHVIPTVDIARLFAARGVKSTIVTTHFYAPALTKITDRDRESGLDIGIQTVHFPAKEVGLPEGFESMDTLDSPEMAEKFFKATDLLQEPLEKLVEQYRPDVIVADMFLTWANDVADKFGVPRLVFHGTNFFSQCVQESVKVHEPHNAIPAEVESILVPGLPDKIEVKRSQLPDHIMSPGPISKLMERMRDAEQRSYGVIMNSFYELEPAYAEHYRNVMGRKAWHIGPVSLRNKDTVDKSQRGKRTSVDEHYVLHWLDLKKQNSVLYICFGSMSRNSSLQLKEIAMGLEESGVSFIWVIRKSKKADDEEEDDFLPDGYEERLQGKGLIIRDWAPQVLILDHEAIGGFMTHCGWNSILEGISAGVPLITWPMFAEQFYNEIFVTQILKIGIKVGVKNYNSWIDVTDDSVRKENIQEVVTQLLSNGEETVEMRRKMKELGEMAKRAVQEGGSSYKDFSAMIEEFIINKQTSTHKTW